MRIAFAFMAILLPMAQVQAQGQGVVEGRLTNGTNPSSVPAKVALDVISPSGGMAVLKTSVTDARGGFRVTGLPTDMPLVIRADYKDIMYYGQPRFDASGTARVEIQVFEPTASMQGIRVENARIALKLTADGLMCLESYTFNNQTSPPRTFMRPEGSFRFSKAPGISEPPRLDVTAPGASMPVLQPPLESADGKNYYSLYPLRPGATVFEIQQALPYQNHSYTYGKKFFEDVGTLEVDLMPQDMTVSGEGLARVQADAEHNFAVYSAGPIKAGAVVAWTFSGGTPVADAPPAAAEPAQESAIRPMPNVIGRNALIIGPLMLLGLIVALWYAHNRGIAVAGDVQDARISELKERREHLLTYIADLDARYESHAVDRREYLRLREQGKRHLRRIAVLLAKK